MSRNNLIISDAEHLFAEKILRVYLSTIGETGAELLQLLEQVRSNALEEPYIGNRLIGLSEQLGTWLQRMETLEKQLAGQAESFIVEIDQKDQFIY